MMKEALEHSESKKKKLGFIFGLLGFIVIIFLTEYGVFSFNYGDTLVRHPLVGRMLALTWLMATWWMTEALPIPITS